MSANPQAETNRNPQRRERLQAITLTAWDLARDRTRESRDPRAHVMTLRTHERLRLLAEAELGVEKHMRSFLRLGEASQPGVLLVHDTDQTPAHLVPLGRALHEAGLTVHWLLLTEREHGVTLRPEARWRATLQRARQGHELLARASGQVYVLGTGFGAALAMHLARRQAVAGLILLAPAIQPQANLWLRLLRNLRLLRVPAIRRRLGTTVDELEGMQEAQDLTGKLDVPVFGAMCDDDDQVPPEALRMLQKRVRNPRSRFRAFPAGGHDVLAAHGSASLDADIIDFIKRRD